MVEIFDETRRLPRAETIERALQRLLDDLGLGGRSLTVVILDDDAMRERNRRDRGEDAATDVLSYPTFEPGGVPMPTVEHLGDLFVALGVAERQAAERGHELAAEVLVLLAHGLTHLRGFDHGEPGQVDEVVPPSDSTPNSISWTPFRAAERRVLELAEL